MPHKTEDNSVDIEFTKSFFVQNRHKEVLDSELRKLDVKNIFQMKSYFKNILELDDSYITLYLINKLKPKCKYVTNEIIQSFAKFINNYNKKCEYTILDADKIVKILVIDNFCETVTIDVFLESFCTLNFDENDINYFKDIFGYTQIYKHYKEVVNDIFRKPKTYKYMGLMFKMLDNPKLVYNSLLPIFERLTAHVVDNFVDTNLLQSVETLKGIIAYEQDVLLGKIDYITSVSSFLIKIYENPHNFRFLTYADCNKILKGIEIMAYHCKKYPKMLNLSTGIFRSTYDALKELVDRETTVFEEFVSITCLLKILYIYYGISHEMGSRAYDYEEIFDYIQRIVKKEPKGVSKNDWKMINNKFLVRKYMLLNVIQPMLQTNKLDCDAFNKTIENCETVNEFFAKTKNLYQYIDWTSLMPTITKKEKQLYFFKIIHDGVLLEKNQKLWLQNVTVYAESLIKYSDYDLILFSVSKLTKLFTKNDISLEFIKILLKYYIGTIDVTNDLRITKARQKIQDFMFYHTIKENIEMILSEYIEQLDNNSYKKLNFNVIILFLILIRKSKHIDPEIINNTCRYFIQTLEYNDTNDTELSLIAKTYVASICEILYFQKKEVYFGEKDYKPNKNTFYKMVVALITCYFDLNNISYLNKCRCFLICFLFTANEQQKLFLGGLYKKCDENVYVENINLDDLFSLSMFLRKKYELL
ncbi:hypothetical protein BDAP_002037 [Binucleata daphniae]